MVLLIVMMVFEIINGVSSKDVNEAVALRDAAEEQVIPENDEDVIALREKRLDEVPGVRESIAKALEDVLETSDYDAFEEAYGRDMRIVLEAELKDGAYTDVTLMNQPIYYITDTYPIAIVLDDTLHVFAHYDFESGELVPQYVNRLKEEG